MAQMSRVELPRVALGTFRSRGEEASAAVHCAIRAANLRAFDTASIYKNEVEVGKEVRDAIRDGIVSRSDVFITSKVSPYEMGTEKASKAVDAILERLCLEYVDLLLIHWPGASKVPLSSPQNAVLRMETWRVLEDRLRKGQARSIGVSNYQIAHLEELFSYCDIPPLCNQVECHPKYQQRELREWCDARNVQVVAYSSFGAGNLFDVEAYPEVSQVSREMACTPAQVLLRWGLQKGLCVIPKSAVPERILEFSPANLGPLPHGNGTRYLSETSEALLDGLLCRAGPTKYCWDSTDIL
jgi:diketogulonate reductase-like aldo/keto reductase